MKQFLAVLLGLRLLFQVPQACATQSISKTDSYKTTGSELIGGDFKLTDHAGRQVSLATYRGKYLLVFFGFTHCPSVCPLGLRLMIKAIQLLGTEASQIQSLFISVDPERDSSAVLKKYIRNFDSSLVGLRGTAEETSKILNQYRAYSHKVDVSKHDPKTSYLMDHSSIIYLMSQEGKYLTHFSGNEKASEIAVKIKVYFKKGE